MGSHPHSNGIIFYSLKQHFNICHCRHRERQRTLAANARSLSNNNVQQHGLGRMEDGVGYFPCLAALQFQAWIPGPSPSIAEYENAEKDRLNVILRWISVIVFAYFLLC